MSKLFVQRKKKDAPFHPRLRIESTGYAPGGQWVGLCSRGDVWAGFAAVSQMTASEMIPHYLEELKRMNHKPV